MSMFRRPTDVSSDSSSSSISDNEPLVVINSTGSHDDVEEVVGDKLAATESFSSRGNVSADVSVDAGGLPNLDHHRNVLLASLLEDFYQTRAAELLNTGSPEASYDRQSPEVQALASTLYTQASQALAQNGVLPATVSSEGLRSTRKQYLSGLNNIGLQSVGGDEIQAADWQNQIVSRGEGMALVRAEPHRADPQLDVLRGQVNGLALQANYLNLVGSPAADLRLSVRGPARGHYQSSFQELSMLGRGGFGRVYQAYNLFDRKEYAIKKIPLSTKLSQKYRESGHQELAHVLREVQALAQLDHHNVVRYHATWIEEPTAFPAGSMSAPPATVSMRNQRLLQDRPILQDDAEMDRLSPRHAAPHEHSGGVVFGLDSGSHGRQHDFERLEAHRSLGVDHSHPESTTAGASDVFSDGNAGLGRRYDRVADDPSVYVLHVQMSLYPMTLAQYLSPAPINATSGLATPIRRHCFHLIPALRILLGILCGLQYIHARGLLHRDIKPSNIFLSTLNTANPILMMEGYHDVGSCSGCPRPQSHFLNPRIGDFGLVADLVRSACTDRDRLVSGERKAVGTEYYRPPPWKGSTEERSIRRLDEKLDVFALGVVLVEMLWQCGTSMERAGVLRGLQHRQLPRGFAQSIDSEGHDSGTGALVEACVLGMIEPDPDQRWGCARVQEALQGIHQRCRRRGIEDDVARLEDGETVSSWT